MGGGGHVTMCLHFKDACPVWLEDHVSESRAVHAHEDIRVVTGLVCVWGKREGGVCVCVIGDSIIMNVKKEFS